MPNTDLTVFRREEVDIPKLKYGGYIYAIEFNTGLVKVGKSQNPTARLETHRSHGVAFGAKLMRYWVSAPHDNYDQNERLLIGGMRDLGGVSNRAEYFSGVSVEEAVTYCAEFEYTVIDVEDYEHRAALASDAFKLALIEKFGDIQPDNPSADTDDQFVAIDQMFGAVTGSDPNAHFYPIVTRSAIPLSRVRELAIASNIPLAELTSWNMIDIIELTIKTRVQLAALRMVAWAEDYGRDDLLSPLVVDVSS